MNARLSALMLIEAETHAMRAPREQNCQTREPWPVSQMAAIKSMAEDTLVAATVG